MTAATLTLTDFLLARIAEDEAAAVEARDLQDYMPSGAWNLDRVLAECAAKRGHRGGSTLVLAGTRTR